ncbi:MAG: T9SS type A sorting domain-containing protein [Owenweeksia sp.]
MKKLYISLLFLLSLSVSHAQVVQNETVTDCDNNSRSIYSTLAAGKVLMVASEGFDCSNCMSKAPGLQNWAAQHTNSIDVWGAMTFTYSGNTPNCTDVNDWKNKYSWTDIFTFIDSGRKWFGAGTPQYFVYNPQDSSLAYQGFSESTARTTAENLANSTIGIRESINARAPFYVSQGEGFFQLNNLPLTTVQYQLFDLTGKVVKSQTFSDARDVQRISTNDIKKGLYLVKVKGVNGFEAVKKVLVR